MKSMIYCQTTKKGVLSFYLVLDGKRYYLFSQKYRKSVKQYFRRGVSINQSIDFSKAHKNTALEKTMSKIPMYLRYVEKEYRIQVLQKTKRILKCA